MRPPVGGFASISSSIGIAKKSFVSALAHSSNLKEGEIGLWKVETEHAPSPHLPSNLLHLTSLVRVAVVAVVAGAFGEGLGGDSAAYAVLDGDGFHSGGVAEGEGFAVEAALSGGGAAVGGVADFAVGRAGDGYLSGVGEGGVARDGRRCYGFSLRVLIVLGVLVVV